MGNTGLDKISFNNEWRMTNGSKQTSLKLPIDAVDKMVEALVAEYQNPDYKKWYYKVVYEFGFAKVEEWQRRAREGSEPGKLFTKYVNDARKYNQAGEQQAQADAKQDTTSTAAIPDLDDIPLDDERGSA